MHSIESDNSKNTKIVQFQSWIRVETISENNFWMNPSRIQFGDWVFARKTKVDCVTHVWKHVVYKRTVVQISVLLYLFFIYIQKSGTQYIQKAIQSGKPNLSCTCTLNQFVRITIILPQSVCLRAFVCRYFYCVHSLLLLLFRLHQPDMLFGFCFQFIVLIVIRV